MASETQRQKLSLPLLVLLIFLLGIGLLALFSVNIQTNTGTQTASDNPCPAAGQEFDARQEALALAQAAEQYRTAHPFKGIYGFGSYIICFQNGSQQRVQSPPAAGFTNPGAGPPQQSHSEQAIYKWAQQKLSRLSLDLTQVTGIYVVIFSQVTVCGPCQKDMISWQSGLRQSAKTQNVFLSIWDLLAGTGFNPATYPAGSGVPVTIEALRKVPIAFTP